MIQFTDTHTHLYSEEFNEDRDAMILRAIENGVTKLFVPSIDSSYTQQMYALEKQYPNMCFDDGITSLLCKRKTTWKN